MTFIISTDSLNCINSQYQFLSYCPENCYALTKFQSCTEYQYLKRLNISPSKINHISQYVLTALHLMNSYTRSNTVNIMVFHFAKVDVLSGWFSGMLLSDVLRLCSLNNDQDVTSTSTRFTYFIVSKGLLFFTLDFHFL